MKNLCVYNTLNKYCNGVYIYKRQEEIKKNKLAHPICLYYNYWENESNKDYTIQYFGALGHYGIYYKKRNYFSEKKIDKKYNKNRYPNRNSNEWVSYYKYYSEAGAETPKIIVLQ